MEVNKKTLLADAVLLLSETETYQDHTLSDLRTYLLYPIATGNNIPFYNGDNLVAFVTWSFLSKEKGEKLLRSDYTLTYDDYLQRDGEQFWGLDFVAPYGNTIEVFRTVMNMKKETFGDIPVHWRRYSDLERLHKL